MLTAAEKSNLICEVKFASDLLVSHFLFSDDSLIFCMAVLAYFHYLKNIFDIY